jgi:hypothetical protein
MPTENHSGFFAELKRRNVFRVGIAYLIVAWLSLQIRRDVTAVTRGPFLMWRIWSSLNGLLRRASPSSQRRGWVFDVTAVTPDWSDLNFSLTNPQDISPLAPTPALH